MSLYELDYPLWTAEQRRILKTLKWTSLDVDNLLEELEEMGNRHRNALYSHLRVLITHILKWDFQPDYRCSSWAGTIANAQVEIKSIISDCPSLKNMDENRIEKAYRNGRKVAIAETGIGMPQDNPYTIKELMEREVSL